MTNYAEFSNPKLVAIYDAVNPIDSYADFYVDLAAERNAKRVIDLGCGTGLLSHEFAKRGYSVIGLEPAPAMLEQAKEKYGNEAEWIVGSAEALRPGMQADLLIMTGHVAQFFLEDTVWQQAVQNISMALRPGGYLTFESRNPHVQPFTGWPTKERHARIPTTPLGPAEWWSEDLVYENGYATYAIHYLLTTTGETLVSANKLRFRSQEEITSSLQAAGFTVEHVYGERDGRLFQPNDKEMIFVAKKHDA